jgi:hypothetical protein
MPDNPYIQLIGNPIYQEELQNLAAQMHFDAQVQAASEIADRTDRTLTRAISGGLFIIGNVLLWGGILSDEQQGFRLTIITAGSIGIVASVILSGIVPAAIHGAQRFFSKIKECCRPSHQRIPNS